MGAGIWAGLLVSEVDLTLAGFKLLFIFGKSDIKASNSQNMTFYSNIFLYSYYSLSFNTLT